MRKCLENIIETYKMMKINKIIVLLIIGISLGGDIQALKQEKKSNDQDEKLYKRAKSLEKAGLIDEAEQIFIQIFSSTPNNEKYYNALKKYVIKNEDCASLMEYTDIFYKARKFDKFSKMITVLLLGDRLSGLHSANIAISSHQAPAAFIIIGVDNPNVKHLLRSLIEGKVFRFTF